GSTRSGTATGCAPSGAATRRASFRRSARTAANSRPTASTRGSPDVAADSGSSAADGLGFNSTPDRSRAPARRREGVGARGGGGHDDGFRSRAIEWLLESAGISLGDVGHAAFYWNPYEGLARFGAHFVRNLPRSLTYLGKQPSLWGSFLSLPRRLRALGFRGR